MKNRIPLTRDMAVTGGLIALIVAALQARMAITGAEVGPVLAIGAAALIAIILTLAASASAR